MFMERHDTYFSNVFKVYTQLWKFQQENRHKLIEAGLKRWEIGEIASRIGQLYFGQFLTVCLLLNRREVLQKLVDRLKVLVEECKRVFQDSDFKEWKVVVLEIGRFLKADTAFMNVRPLRYSLVLDSHPDNLPHVPVAVAKRNLKLRDAVLSSFHHNEVNFSELTIDTFRMLQSLEWEPSGSFYQSSGSKLSQNGAAGTGRVSYLQDIVDPTLPANPRKAILYRPSLTHFVVVLATICEELPLDGVLLVYLSASGAGSSGAGHNESGCLNFGSRGDK
ncbi:hypothetical protein RYX36_035838 [Vicia faba]